MITMTKRTQHIILVSAVATILASIVVMGYVIATKPEPRVTMITISDKSITLTFDNGKQKGFPGTCSGNVTLVTEIGGLKSDSIILMGCAGGGT